MIYAVPEEAVEDVVMHNLRGMAKYIFVTDRTQDAYNGFGASWQRFVRAIANT